MKTNELLFERRIYEHEIYRSSYQASRMLVEMQLDAKQIDAVFRAVADGAAKGGNVDKEGDEPVSNRTMLGKGADVVTDVAKKFSASWEKVKTAISQSGPVSGFDVMVDKLQGSLLNAAGGQKGAVGTAIQKYRDFGNAHPIMQGAIYAILIALAGITGAGLGGAAIIAGIKVADRLLMGDKASTALWKGFKTGAVAYGAGQLAQHIRGANAQDVTTNVRPGYHDPLYDPPSDVTPNIMPPAPDIPSSVVAAKGDTLSQIAQTHQTSVKALMQANPGITNPDALRVGTEITIPPINSTTYMGGVGTASDTAAKVASGQYDTMGRALARQRFEAKQNKGRRVNEWIDRDATVRKWALMEGLGRKTKRSVMLTPEGVNKVFEQITIRTIILEAEGEEKAKKPGLLSRAWSGIKSVGSAIGGAAKAGWNSATNKITYDKLGMNWRSINAGGGEGAADRTDSADLADFLRSQGVKDGLINSVYKSMGIPVMAAYGTDPIAGKDDKAGAGAGADAGADDGEMFARKGYQAGGEANGPADQTHMQDGPGTQRGAGEQPKSDAGGQQAGGRGALPGFDAGNIGNLKSTLGAVVPKPAAGNKPVPNYGAGPTSYGKTTMSVGGSPAVAPGKTRTGGKVAGQVSQTPNAIRKRNARAGGAEAPAFAPNPFGSMVNQMQSYGTSTGGKVTGTATGLKHTANPNNPNFGTKPAAEPAAEPAKKLGPTRAIKGGKQAEPEKQKVAAEARRVYGGRYVRESIDDRLLKEFEFFINKG